REQITTVGQQPRNVVRWDWSLTGATWQCRTASSHRAGWSEWVKSYDSAGRLVHMARIGGGPSSASITFRWASDLYLGGMQEQVGRASPLRELRTLDSFGLAGQVAFYTIDVDGDGQAVSQAEGLDYCGPNWDAALCSQPLLRQQFWRDTIGRIVSDKW